MTKYKLEYIWLDGFMPTPNLRDKTQIKEFAPFPTLEQLPLCDLVAVGRALLVDPAWTRKVQEARYDELLPFEPAALATLS